jgi:hypothetical protein
VNGYLLDTNLISELRKGPRAHPAVQRWADAHAREHLCISVLTLGEIRLGIERIRLRDPAQADALDRWRQGLVALFGERILRVDRSVAEAWGGIGVEQPLPPIDGLIAATALVHGLAVVTRNARDFERAGVAMVNPWAD